MYARPLLAYTTPLCSLKKVPSFFTVLVSRSYVLQTSSSCLWCEWYPLSCGAIVQCTTICWGPGCIGGSKAMAKSYLDFGTAVSNFRGWGRPQLSQQSRQCQGKGDFKYTKMVALASWKDLHENWKWTTIGNWSYLCSTETLWGIRVSGTLPEAAQSPR